MDIQLFPATDSDRDLIKNLVLYYVYDMSEYMGWNCNDKGRWDGCDDLPDYWEKPGHQPYVIRVDGSVAGFVLMRPFPNEPERYEFGDFFVARAFKGRGVGKASAFRAFDAHPGKWLVRVLDGNHGALAFWAKVVDEYTEGDFVQTTEQYEDLQSGTWDMQFYRFESKTNSQQKDSCD